MGVRDYGPGNNRPFAEYGGTEGNDKLDSKKKREVTPLPPLLKALADGEDGQGMAESAIILALVAMVVFLTLSQFGVKVTDLLRLGYEAFL